MHIQQQQTTYQHHLYPDERGRYGDFGGKFVPESLMAALAELESAYQEARSDAVFQSELQRQLHSFVGRPTTLHYVPRFSQMVAPGVKVYLKREDLAHTGAHKINNALGQGLLARSMGKRRIIAETGAGQHGVATATVCAMLGIECVVYMGEEDIHRQAPNVATTYYVIGSVVGPHPYPQMVRDFQSVIGSEARQQMLEAEGRLPDVAVACVGGGSNAMGLFHPFYEDREVRLIGVEAAGSGVESGKHAATLVAGRPGVLHGSRSYLLQDEHGQILETHSISAGLDYPGVGPEHSFYRDSGRAEYVAVDDAQALEGFQLLCRTE